MPKSSSLNLLSIAFLMGVMSLMNSFSASAQCLVMDYSGTMNAGQKYIACQQKGGSTWGYCYVYNVRTGQYSILSNTENQSLKVINKNKALSAADIAKMPGMGKFKPFAGNDDVYMEIGPKLLTFQADDQGGSGSRLDLCQEEGATRCKNSTTWAITKDEKASVETFYIQPNHDKKSYLCFSPGSGITVHRDPAETDDCIQWSIVPGQLGTDGEITSYTIIPKKHPEYILAADTRSNQITVQKINTKHGEVTEPELTVRADWTFKPNKVKKVTNQKERVIMEAEEK